MLVHKPIVRAETADSCLLIVGAGPDRQELDRVREALQVDAADRVELQVFGLADRVRHGGGDEHLAAERAGDHAVGEVDVGPEVVAVAVDGAAVMDADARLRALLKERQETYGPL